MSHCGAPSHWRFPVGICVGRVVSVCPVSLVAWHQHVSEHFNVWTCLQSVPCTPPPVSIGIEVCWGGRLISCEFSSPKSGISILCHFLLPIFNVRRWQHLPRWSGATWAHTRSASLVAGPAGSPGVCCRSPWSA